MGNIELMNEAFDIANEISITGIGEKVFNLLDEKKKHLEEIEKQKILKYKLLSHYEALLVKVACVDINNKQDLKHLQHEALKTLDLLEIVK